MDAIEAVVDCKEVNGYCRTIQGLAKALTHDWSQAGEDARIAPLPNVRKS